MSDGMESVQKGVQAFDSAVEEVLSGVLDGHVCIDAHPAVLKDALSRLSFAANMVSLKLYGEKHCTRSRLLEGDSKSNSLGNEQCSTSKK